MISDVWFCPQFIDHNRTELMGGFCSQYFGKVFLSRVQIRATSPAPLTPSFAKHRMVKRLRADLEGSD